VDLVDEMNWEDSDKVEFLSLEDAGLEDFPVFDNVFTVQVNNYYLLEDTINGD
jgi:hypothetical protein